MINVSHYFTCQLNVCSKNILVILLKNNYQFIYKIKNASLYLPFPEKIFIHWQFSIRMVAKLDRRSYSSVALRMRSALLTFLLDKTVLRHWRQKRSKLNLIYFVTCKVKVNAFVACVLPFWIITVSWNVKLVIWFFFLFLQREQYAS